MAEEEDVVFEKSALYEYLKDVGFADADIGTETLKPRERKEQISRVVATQCKGWLSKVLAHITWPVQRLSARSSLLSASSKQQQCARYIVHNILRCPVLEEEDGAVIQHYTCDIDDMDAKSHDISCDIPPWSSDMTIRHGPVWGVLLASVQVASLTHLFYRHWQGTAHYWDLSTVGISVSALVMRHQVAMATRACDHTRTVCHFIADIGKFYKLTKKSVRLIQETELIAKGFTMVGNNSAICQLEKANLQASRRQSTQLRRIVFEAARDCMILFKAKTEKLLQERPVTHTCSYMATISLEDYGPCITLASSSNELKLATDDYSITALKSVVHLCNAHVSEFLRVFALAYFPSHKSVSTGRIDRELREMCARIRAVERDFTRHWERLEQAYTVHQCSWQQKTETRSGTALRKPRTVSQSGTAYVTMHSLSLHLQAALKRVHDLEVQLESLCEDDDSDLTTDLQLQLASDLKVIKVNLDACNDCWESLNDLDGHSRDVHQDADQLTDCGQSEDSGVSPTVHPPHLVDMSEPFLEDQMYEAFPDTEDVDHSDRDEDTERLLAKEEKEAKRREKREALRMLSELKGVIALRALEKSCHTRPSQGAALSDDLNDIKLPDDRTEEKSSRVEGMESHVHTQAISDPETCISSNGTSVVTEDDTQCETHVNDISQQTEETSHLPAETTKVAFGLYGSIVVDGAGGRFPHLDKQQTQQDLSGDTSDEDKQDSGEEREGWLSEFPSSQPQCRDKLGDPCEPCDVTSEQMCERPILGMSFTATVALQAVARSRQMAALSVDTFGDDSDSEAIDGEDGQSL